LRRLGTILLTALFLAFAALIAAGFWVYSELETPFFGARTPEVFVDIPRGSRAGSVAELLVRAGVLRDSIPFRIYLRYTDTGRRIQAGEYRFSEAATPKQVARRLAEGDVFYYSVTVPEGLTARETVDLLEKNGLGKRVELNRAIRNAEWIRDLDPNARNLEGYLFPETYRFRRNADSRTIIKTMVDEFRARLEKILPLYPVPPDWSLSRAVVLASMIEKEVKTAEEGPLVASVLVNRLAMRMPLACDATIIYAMKLAGTYEGRLGKTDMAMESPYNTYRHSGLPPGPICNPGSDSLKAALRPAKSDFYYYVSRNDGTHQFSKDFNSHLRAVNLYQKPLAAKRQ
jgi:UPF0755 protein